MTLQVWRERRILSRLADRLAPEMVGKTSWDELRAAIDLATGAELGAYHLDIVTDMVASRYRWVPLRLGLRA